MTVYELIKKKRDGEELTFNELQYLVNGYNIGVIPDYQISAFLMAVYFIGMTAKETHSLTMAMVESGQTIDLSEIMGIKVDKHSSGGVADTVSLVVVPIAAAGGVPIAKMSGRGLGHTGGTIDKLESIPGFNTKLSMTEFFKLVKEVGVAVAGQTSDLAPADKKLYALRDVTATVDSIPLIAASIMSKKLASGADAILLDVKTGSGAFMKDPQQAKELAQLMVDIGKQAGKKMLAFVTDMNQPLGQAIGNSLEIQEALEVLKGKGSSRLKELCVKIAAGMLWLGEKSVTLSNAEIYARQIIDSGAALHKFKQFLTAQGGDATICENYRLLPQAQYSKSFVADKSGYLNAINTEAIGLASVKLGAGRSVKDAAIDHAAGIIVHKNIGDRIQKGEELSTLYSSVQDTFSLALDNLHTAFIITEKPSKTPTLIYEILT